MIIKFNIESKGSKIFEMNKMIQKVFEIRKLEKGMHISSFHFLQQNLIVLYG